MAEFFESSVFFGVFISLITFGFGSLLKKKLKLALFNPILISVILTIIFLKIFGVSYEKYNQGAKLLSYLLTPATICLAVPLYEQFELLKKNWAAVLTGILTGTVVSLVSVLILAYLFKLDHASYVTLLPKSITSAIGMGVSEELGGYAALTVSIIIITGIFGNMIAVGICRIFHITEPIAKGVAIGTSSHAMGTTKAMELGEVEGAMSGLSIVVAGLLTVVGAGIFANFM